MRRIEALKAHTGKDDEANEVVEVGEREDEEAVVNLTEEEGGSEELDRHFSEIAPGVNLGRYSNVAEDYDTKEAAESNSLDEADLFLDYPITATAELSEKDSAT